MTSTPHRSRIATLQGIVRLFRIPLLVITGIILGLISQYGWGNTFFARIVWIVVVVIGSIELVKVTALAIYHRIFALDYIALLAISIGIISGQYLVAAVIVLMLSGGEALEDYSMEQAKSSLTALANRIPSDVLLWHTDAIGDQVKIETVKVGQEIYIRKGEVIPLDGTLKSAHATCDESSLTGEAYPVEKTTGDTMRSGTVNLAEAVIITVTKAEKDSTYRQIVNMVTAAQAEKAPLIRLADRYSTIFTIITIMISVAAYFFSGGQLSRVLAVLVIATPCPLILATPIALMGGMNAAAKRRIIFKRLGSIEQLSRVNALIFDKTGTITVGRPEVTRVEQTDPSFDEQDAYGITYALERNSLHPIAKALLTYLKPHISQMPHLTEIVEDIGRGIKGTRGSHTYTLGKPPSSEGMVIALAEDSREIMRYHLEDVVKSDSQNIFQKLHDQGISLSVFSGDKKENAERLRDILQIPLTIQAECTPEDKKEGIRKLKESGHTTAMIGDGINDAPALASADVGMVYANEENTAATEAADVVFLGGELSQVGDALSISKRTITIALQSIIVGIGLSTLGMVLASVGIIPPIVGAFIQEAIDVAVILNALRAR